LADCNHYQQELGTQQSEASDAGQAAAVASMNAELSSDGFAPPSFDELTVKVTLGVPS
jgi:hypothetical protein